MEHVYRMRLKFSRVRKQLQAAKDGTESLDLPGKTDIEESLRQFETLAADLVGSLEGIEDTNPIPTYESDNSDCARICNLRLAYHDIEADIDGLKNELRNTEQMTDYAPRFEAVENSLHQWTGHVLTHYLQQYDSTKK